MENRRSDGKNARSSTQLYAEIVPAARQRASDELASIQAVIDKQQGGFSAQPWDWAFYAEQVRREKFDLDEAQLKPYFELNTVLNEGVFWTANQLFGIKFVERFDIPVYHPDVRVWEIFDHNGVGLALFYGDFFARDSKSGGAWMGNFVEQSTLNETHPVIYNVCNYQKPAAGEPALLLWDDVITLFHEFGHTLHGLLPASVMPRFPAPTRRVILSNFRRKSTNTGQRIRRYSLATPGIIRAGQQCLTNCNRKCVMPACSTKGMR